jgi:hypothetical protein
MNINKLVQKLQELEYLVRSMDRNIEIIVKDNCSYISDWSVTYLDSFRDDNKKAIKKIREIENDLGND